MNNEEIRIRVIAVISKTLSVNPDLITEDTSIGDLPEWDSVGNLSVILAIENSFGVEIPIEDLFDLTTVSSFCEEVQKLKA